MHLLLLLNFASAGTGADSSEILQQLSQWWNSKMTCIVSGRAISILLRGSIQQDPMIDFGLKMSDLFWIRAAGAARQNADGILSGISCYKHWQIWVLRISLLSLILSMQKMADLFTNWLLWFFLVWEWRTFSQAVPVSDKQLSPVDSSQEYRTRLFKSLSHAPAPQHRRRSSRSTRQQQRGCPPGVSHAWGRRAARRTRLARAQPVPVPGVSGGPAREGAAPTRALTRTPARGPLRPLSRALRATGEQRPDAHARRVRAGRARPARAQPVSAPGASGGQARRRAAANRRAKARWCTGGPSKPLSRPGRPERLLTGTGLKRPGAHALRGAAGVRSRHEWRPVARASGC